jgi:SAM-dependent methyltransferase
VSNHSHYALPEAELLQQQAGWLAGARGRLLRGAGIAHRRRILDLGAGYGAVTGELARRAGGLVVALDREESALRHITAGHSVGGDVLNLPFADESFDLVFCQCVLMWVGDGVSAMAEIHRILQPGGVLIAIEPDYGGMIEYPPDIVTRDLWLAALKRVGAEACMGRMLPGLLAKQGFQLKIHLLDEIAPSSSLRFEFLQGLPLTEAETAVLSHIQLAAATLPLETQVAHLPFVLVTANK